MRQRPKNGKRLSPPSSSGASCQRSSNLAGAIDEQSRQRTEAAILRLHDGDGKWIDRKLDRQCLYGEARCKEMQKPLAEMSHELARFEQLHEQTRGRRGERDAGRLQVASLECVDEQGADRSRSHAP